MDLNLNLKSLNFKRPTNQKMYLPLVYEGLKAGVDFETLKKIYKLKGNSLDEYIASFNVKSIGSLNASDLLKYLVERDGIKERVKKSVIQNLTYPFMLFCIASALTILYIRFFVPSVRGMLLNLGYEETMGLWFSKMTYLLLMLFLIVLISILILACFKKNRILLYIQCHRFMPFKLLKQIVTLEFVFTYLFFLKHEIATFDVLKMMRNMKETNIMRWLAYHIHERLDRGEDVLEAFDLSYFDALYPVLFSQGYYSGGLIEMHQIYVNLLLETISHYLKRLSSVLKLIFYVYIMIYIAMFYSLLFQPLRILEGL